MLIENWVKESMYEDDDAGAVKLIRLRAWQYFRDEIEDNFILGVFGIVGRVRKIFTKIFGEEIHSL